MKNNNNKLKGIIVAILTTILVTGVVVFTFNKPQDNIEDNDNIETVENNEETVETVETKGTTESSIEYDVTIPSDGEHTIEDVETDNNNLTAVVDGEAFASGVGLPVEETESIENIDETEVTEENEVVETEPVEETIDPIEIDQETTVTTETPAEETITPIETEPVEGTSSICVEPVTPVTPVTPEVQDATGTNVWVPPEGFVDIFANNEKIEIISVTRENAGSFISEEAYDVKFE